MIKKFSYFKDENQRNAFFEKWVGQVESTSGSEYEMLNIATSLGNTVVYSVENNKPDAQTLVIFPGFRTSSLFWDFDNVLGPLKETCRIFLVETNGQPNLSDGNSPGIKGDGYGRWAAEVFEQLSIKRAIIAGASFGGLVCLKLCLVASSLVEKVILLNPGCLQPFSMSLRNLYYNLLPIMSPSRKNIEKFLDKAVISNDHMLTNRSKELLIDFEEFVLTGYVDKTEKPYAMRADELTKITNDVYLLVGDKDILFPYEKSLATAQRHLLMLRGTYVLPNTAHGIETSRKAMMIVRDIIGR